MDNVPDLVLAVIGAAARPHAEAAAHVGRIAALHAHAVDRDARFPAEAVEALRDTGLLGLLVSREHGGPGGSVRDAAGVCQVLAGQCASTALIYAMHLSQLGCLVAHGAGVPWHDALLRRAATGQVLMASVTSENATGGDLAHSACAVVTGGGRFTLEKSTPQISYGMQADALLVSARRAPDAAAGDQVLAVVLQEDTVLERTGTWNTLGMRGTCSHGFRLQATGDTAQVLPGAFAVIAAGTMVPVSHMMWCATWIGIAADALGRARAFLRSRARRSPAGHPGHARLTAGSALLQTLQHRLLAALHTYEELCRAGLEGDAPALLPEMNTLKLSVSEGVLRVVDEAMLICGMAGYRNETEFSLGQHLRDLHSARLMVNNDRIAADTGAFLAVQRAPLVTL